MFEIINARRGIYSRWNTFARCESRDGGDLAQLQKYRIVVRAVDIFLIILFILCWRLKELIRVIGSMPDEPSAPWAKCGWKISVQTTWKLERVGMVSTIEVFSTTSEGKETWFFPTCMKNRKQHIQPCWALSGQIRPSGFRGHIRFRYIPLHLTSHCKPPLGLTNFIWLNNSYKDP
jgi:hypothetical protein